jgi:hypothetical protein
MAVWRSVRCEHKALSALDAPTRQVRVRGLPEAISERAAKMERTQLDKGGEVLRSDSRIQIHINMNRHASHSPWR